jgi:hypothetical protein
MPSRTTPISHATVPLNLNTPQFLSAWDEYVQYRRERRLPKLLPRSVQKQWDRLSDFGPEVAVEAINETVRQGWIGIFPERVTERGAGQLPGRGSAPRASLGALQMQLKQVEAQLEDIFYPGGCAFRVEPSPENRERSKHLLGQRLNLKRQIEELSCQ